MTELATTPPFGDTPLFLSCRPDELTIPEDLEPQGSFGGDTFARGVACLIVLAHQEAHLTGWFSIPTLRLEEMARMRCAGDVMDVFCENPEMAVEIGIHQLKEIDAIDEYSENRPTQLLIDHLSSCRR